MALEPCTGCGAPVWPENNPCDNCKENPPVKEEPKTKPKSKKG